MGGTSGNGARCMNLRQRDEAKRTNDKAKGLAELTVACETWAMLNILSLVIGVITLFLAVFAFIPLLGWANWIIIPFAIIGAGLGAMSSKTSGRNLCIVVIVAGALRLMIGGGIF